jgi:NAD(P)-dependent dehydrogenase (short-subunit alcohol dehydrogenase family)
LRSSRAAAGLGRGFACALATAGAAVAVAARSADEIADTVSIVRDAGGRACAFQLDVVDATAIDSCVAAVEHELGPIDLLVNNAGVASPAGMDWEVDPSVWWRTLEVNLRGPFLCARAVLPGMIARRRGRIINISSSAAFGNNASLSAYGVSKAALTHWSGRLAAQVEQDGVAVIAYAPSVVRTAMTETLATSPDWIRITHGGFQRMFEEGRDDSLERTVEAFMLLASGRADALTGRHLSVSDDLTHIEAAGGRARAVPDVVDRAAVDAAVREAELSLGPVDLLVNNAAQLRALGEVWQVDPEGWWRDVEINLRGPFLCARAVLQPPHRRHIAAADFRYACARRASSATIGTSPPGLVWLSTPSARLLPARIAFRTVCASASSGLAKRTALVATTPSSRCWATASRPRLTTFSAGEP